MSVKQFHQEVSKGLTSSAYLLYSTEDFLLYEALSLVKDLIAPSSAVSGGEGFDAFNLDIFDIKSPDGSISVDQMVDILNTLPFLADRRTVVVKNVQKLAKKDLKKLEDYLLKPSETSLLVMLFEGKTPKIFDTSALKKTKVIALTMQESDIPLWIREKAKERGIELTTRAVDYLVCSVGTDLGMLYSEIEKFSSWQVSSDQDRQEKRNRANVIDLEDIKGLVYSGAEYDAFDLVNALNRKDSREIFRIVENVSKNMEPQMLLGALNWQYTNMYVRSQGRESVKFRKIFQILHEADIATKTSSSYTLEEVLIRLLSIN